MPLSAITYPALGNYSYFSYQKRGNDFNYSSVRSNSFAGTIRQTELLIYIYIYMWIILQQSVFCHIDWLWTLADFHKVESWSIQIIISCILCESRTVELCVSNGNDTF